MAICSTERAEPQAELSLIVDNSSLTYFRFGFIIMEHLALKEVHIIYSQGV